MSLRYEQYRAMKEVRDLVYDLIYTSYRPKWSELRQRARRVIKHYPMLKESGEPMFSCDSISDDISNKTQTKE